MKHLMHVYRKKVAQMRRKIEIVQYRMMVVAEMSFVRRESL